MLRPGWLGNFSHTPVDTCTLLCGPIYLADLNGELPQQWIGSKGNDDFAIHLWSPRSLDLKFFIGLRKREKFVISLFVLNKGFSIGLSLSKFLQKSNIDLKLAQMIQKKSYKNFEHTPPIFFKKIFELEERFTVHQSILSGFDSLFRENGPIEDIIILSNKYIEDLQNDGTQNEIIEAEYKL
ncbi:hypothetical protein AGLY_010719 [Aphis glycines]|uniref:Uncharacterized protein n=1 Tax=Aphis glycines TaxID=307491 RepID=A0A6G0TGK5_APHGL|nr:hypothetical protein AGLY_010719 [Aphis glycines]